MSAALLCTRSQTQMLHIPFKGNAPALTEVITNRVDFMFYPMVGVLEREAQKQVRILAVTTAQRNPDAPHVPTMAEAGFPGFEKYTVPIGFLTPAGTPPAVLDKLSNSIRATLHKPEIIQRIRQLGGMVIASSPTEYRNWLREDHARWEQLIRIANVKE